MKMLEKRILLVVLAAALPLFVGGCERHAKSEQYFLIATNIGLPYWQSAHAGFARAAAEYGVTEDMRGPDTFTPAIEVGAAVVFLGMLTALVIPGVRRSRAARAVHEGDGGEIEGGEIELYLDRWPKVLPEAVGA